MTLTLRRGSAADGQGRLEPLQAGPAPAQDPQVREQAADILVELFRYLREHAVRQPLLAPAVAALRDAVVQHRAGSQDPLRGPRLVVLRIQEARQLDTTLP